MFLDGLHRPQPVPPLVTNRPRRRRWGRSIGISVLACLLTTTAAVSLWIEPILAALPMTRWHDRLTLLKALQPGVYLVLFQNPHELRPTGGFLGSFAEVELGWAGQIKSIEVETNIYQRDGRYASAVNREPPEPLRAFLGDQPWALRDSNWALDFPEAAQLVAWFYEHEGGRPVDGVIALTADVLARLLEVTGPLSLPAYQTTLTSMNVIATLQKEIERDYWADSTHQEENQPKTILADTLPLLVGRLRTAERSVLVRAVAAALNEKEIQAYLRDPALAHILAEAGWDGHVSQASSDYLYLNEANLSPVDGRARLVGAKSSASIERSLHLERLTAPGNRAVIHTVTLLRTHRGEAVWPDGPNTSFLRLAVPSGATLLEATRNGLDITAEVRFSLEASKAVFGWWSRLDPGETETVTLRYLVPATGDTSLTLVRQPGVQPFPVELSDEGTGRWAGRLDRDWQLD